MQMQKILGQSKYLNRALKPTKQDTQEGYCKPTSKLAWEVRQGVSLEHNFGPEKHYVKLVQSKPQPQTYHDLLEEME